MSDAACIVRVKTRQSIKDGLIPGIFRRSNQKFLNAVPWTEWSKCLATLVVRGGSVPMDMTHVCCGVVVVGWSVSNHVASAAFAQLSAAILGLSHGLS